VIECVVHVLIASVFTWKFPNWASDIGYYTRISSPSQAFSIFPKKEEKKNRRREKEKKKRRKTSSTQVRVVHS